MMLGSEKENIRRRRALLSMTVLSVAGFAAKQVYDYAAPPAIPKDCSFPYPYQTVHINGTMIAVRYPHTLPFSQTGGFINDASCLNKTQVYAVVQVQKEQDVQNAIFFAKEHHLKVSVAGQQHSMGGQTFIANGLVLDMKGFKKIMVDTDKKMISVQAGALWADVQKVLDPLGLSVEAMQSINIFTVGGTLSVNAHGISHHLGQVAPTVQSIKVMTEDGQIKTASRHDNPELFQHVLGGYGLFGVILEADIRVTSNEFYALENTTMDYKDFPAYFEKTISGNDAYGLFYARLSISPVSYLRETAIHAFRRVHIAPEALPPITPQAHPWFLRLVINFSKTGSMGRWLRWTLEKYAVPRIRPCYESRNQIMSRQEHCITTRNKAMFDSMQFLKNRLSDTDILQEYFIPKNRFSEFVDGLRFIVQQNKANLLNVTVRIVHRDRDTALPYATEDEMFALVLYFNQKLDEKYSKVLEKTTTDLIDLVQSMGGRFYLPYQLYYTTEALLETYPEAEDFFATKKMLDPEEVFSNKFFEKYGS